MPTSSGGGLGSFQVNVIVKMALALGMAPLFAGSASAQMDCSRLHLSGTTCAQATDQYDVLASFQALPNTQAGLNVLQADLSTVAGIYLNATPGQRNQAATNSYLSGTAGQQPYAPQVDIWSQIAPGSPILPTLQLYPQIGMSGALATALANQIPGQAGVYDWITTGLGGNGATQGIYEVLQVGPLKDSFTAYALGYPGQSTIYAYPSGQNDPRPYQLSQTIAGSPWTTGQASASSIANQQEEWGAPGSGGGYQTSGGYPSGHSTYGETTALFYAMLVPQAYQSMMVSGQQFGLSRNILGVHHTLDVIGARILTYYTMTQVLAGNPLYELAGIPDFKSYVHDLSSQLANTLGPSLVAVPYSSCVANIAACLANGVIPTTSQFAAANQAYASQATYGLPAMGATDVPAIVPASAELLIESRFPYLNDAQRREVLATTELPSGGPLDDGTGWVRLNLFKAAGGYGAFNSDVSVTLDAAKGGFHAVDMWSNDISGLGGLTKGGSGLLILGGNNSYTGGTRVTEGTLALSGTMVGDLTIDAGARFVSGGGYSVTRGATLENRGTFQSAVTSLLNDGTFTNDGTLIGGLVNGGTTINRGSIRGSILNGGTFVQAGAAFDNNASFINNGIFSGGFDNTGVMGGTGTFAGAVTNHSVIAPGNSIGTLNVAGSFAQTAGGTFQVEVNAAGQADRVAVTGAPGTATLGGSVAVVAANGVFAPSTTYTILSATGGIVGTYAGLTNAFPFLRGTLTYDANNVLLTLSPGGFAAGSATGNQAAVGAALDRGVAGATGDFAAVVGAMATLDLPAAQVAMNSMSGQNYAGFSTANLGTGFLFMNAVGTQISAARTGDLARVPANGSRVALAEACEIEACAASPWSLWGTGLAGFGSVAGNANAGTVTYNAGGAATGIDYRFDPRLLAGIGIGYAGGRQWVNGLSGQGTTDAYQATLYASFGQGGFWADALAGYAYNDNRMTRQIVAPGLPARTASGSTGANQFLGQVEAGYRFGLYPSAAASIAPFARLQGTTITQNGFSETGAGALSLNVAQQTTNSLRSTLGVELTGAVPAGSGNPLDLLLRLGWAHEYADTARPVSASFTGAPGSNFTVLGAQPARDAGVLSLAANSAVGEATSVYVRYDGEVGGGSDAHAITAGFRMVW